jgi:hypothetical protein
MAIHELPEVVDVVPADQADALVAATRDELADLRARTEAAISAADAAERLAQAQGADPIVLGRATEQAERFLEAERDRVDGELKALLDAAADQARARIDAARAEADRIVAAARRLAPSTPVVPAPAVPLPEPQLPGEPLWLAPATIAPAPAPAPAPEPEPPAEAPAEAPTALRLGPLPVYALLQVVALTAVLVVLLAYVS